MRRAIRHPSSLAITQRQPQALTRLDKFTGLKLSASALTGRVSAPIQSIPVMTETAILTPSLPPVSPALTSAASLHNRLNRFLSVHTTVTSLLSVHSWVTRLNRFLSVHTRVSSFLSVHSWVTRQKIVIIVKRQKCYSFIVDRIWSLYSKQTENSILVRMNGQKLLLYCQQTENWSLCLVNRQKTSPLCEQAKKWSQLCEKAEN